jgi:GT2 family glycosyltransferase
VQMDLTNTLSKSTAQVPILISVIIPTYRRPEMLVKCVNSILAGIRQPDQIVIVGRAGDKETELVFAMIEAAPHEGVEVRAAWVTEPGHVPPIETGLRTASGELVAVIDDDVTVTREWLSSMVLHFPNPTIGVVGGRVLVPGAPLPKAKGRPGCLSWYGKVWGNLGSVGGSTEFEVDSVMEGNCMWRRELLASLEFDPVLNFDDASMYGLDLCLQAKKRGLKVVYDPRGLVYHHAAPRAPELNRQERGGRIFSYCRNYTYIILKRLSPWRRLAFLCWWFLIGERDGWGIGSLAFDKLSGEWGKKRYFTQAWRGKIEGIRLRLQ